MRRKEILKGLFVVAAAFAVAGLSLRAWAGPKASMFFDVSPPEAMSVLEKSRGNPDFVVLDVRTPAEFRTGHIEGAILVDYQSPAFRDEIGRFDRERTYLLYCRTGNRSGAALPLMRELGFARVYHLRDGITAWTAAGLPVTE